MLSAQIGDRQPGLMLLRHGDDLPFREPAAAHGLVLATGQYELQAGLARRGNVTPSPAHLPDVQMRKTILSVFGAKLE
ncbi:hypothetical protein XFLAVUS301_32880 [Xanthobacter flavus]|uniref:Uncharacterized protein n=1 Tax=Xanthobacter flavus TaxID=281 RepID=A0A9W6CMT8_XANFL|nr:hypothetical protein XFLAVUS301_32880 [Xanthobacter flavus]